MKLVIVESPTKAKTISNFLGKEFTIDSSFGHVRDLPTSTLGVNVEQNFEPHYVVPKKAKDKVSKIVENAKKADIIYYATDEDREGEAIAWHLDYLLTNKHKTDALRQRIAFHEITKDAIEEALKNPRSIDENLVHAQQARRVLDRLVGYKLSPFLWKKVLRGLSAGRVQSVAVRLIVEKEQEIRKFVKQEYWTIGGVFCSEKNREAVFEASLYSIKERKIEKFDFTTKEKVTEISEKLKKISYKIEKIEEKEIKRKPHPPYKTSTLQQDAHNKLGFSSKQTMLIAQQLYEGIELKDRHTTGLITYMRTDSVNLSNKFIVQCQEYLKNTFGDKYSFTKPRVFKNTAKNTQEAHEAIRPTDIMLHPDLIKDSLDKKQYKLYKLIFERALASLMPEAIFKQKVVDVAGLDSLHPLFRTVGSSLVFDGFLKVYPLSVEDVNLPNLTVHEDVLLLNLKEEQHFTEPPPRYNDASLVKELEKRGIGRPSTYAPIIDTIQKRNYVKRDENKRFIPTEIGELVNKLLEEHFFQIVDYNFTAQMEDGLDDVASNKKSWVQLVRDFYMPFEKNLEQKYTEVDKKQLVEEKTQILCPDCKKHHLIVKIGRFGKFLACPGFPECKHTEPLPNDNSNQKEVDVTPPICPNCKKEMVLKEGRYGKFFACSNYPTCKHTQGIEKPLNIKCPLCTEGEVVTKRTRKGRIFYGCSQYPACSYASWTKPDN